MKPIYYPWKGAIAWKDNESRCAACGEYIQWADRVEEAPACEPTA